MTLDEKLAGVVPHMRQVKFQQLEFYAFIHFTVWQSWANICKGHFRKICLRVPSLLLTEGLYPLFGRIITMNFTLRKRAEPPPNLPQNGILP